MMSSILVRAAPQQLAAASPVGGPTMWMQVWALQGQRGAGQPEPLLPAQFARRASLPFPCCGWRYLSPCLLTFQRRADRAQGGSGGEQRGCPYVGSRAMGVMEGEQRPQAPSSRGLLLLLFLWRGPLSSVVPMCKAVSQSGHHGHLGPPHSLRWGRPMHCRALSSSPGLHPPAGSNSPLLSKV